MFRKSEGPDGHGSMRGRSSSSVRSRGGAIVLVAAIAALAAACSSGTPSSSSSSTTAGNTSTTASAASTTASIKALQQALAQVGCYSGAIDGSEGPTTSAAIKAFQSAAGITVDGIYGPNTQGHLLAADKAGTKVCSSSTPVTTTTTVPATTTTSGSSGSAPCTTAALGSALPAGDTLGNIQCGQGWAAGSATNTMYTYAFLLQSSNGVWVQPPSDACANASSLGIPPAVLANSPCKVS